MSKLSKQHRGKLPAENHDRDFIAHSFVKYSTASKTAVLVAEEQGLVGFIDYVLDSHWH